VKALPPDDRISPTTLNHCVIGKDATEIGLDEPETDRPDAVHRLRAVHRHGSDELATIGQHDGIVQSVAVSPDGKWVASGGYDDLLKIWALGSGGAGGQWVTNLQLGGGPVSSVAFSPDGRWLAARTWTNGFVVLKAPGWQRDMTVTNTEKGEKGSVAFSADSRLHTNRFQQRGSEMTADSV
jgi:WD40 repeat protein